MHSFGNARLVEPGVTELAHDDAVSGSSRAKCDKLTGDGDRQMGIYASPDNWRTGHYFCLI